MEMLDHMRKFIGCMVASFAFALIFSVSAQDAEFCGKIDAKGRLCNVSRRVPSQGDVVLREMPSGFGPFKYDANTKTAVPITDADRSDVEKLATLAPPTVEETSALFVLLSSKATAGQKARAQALADTRATLVTGKAGW